MDFFNLREQQKDELQILVVYIYPLSVGFDSLMFCSYRITVFSFMSTT